MNKWHRNTWEVADALLEDIRNGAQGGPDLLTDLQAQFDAAYKVAPLSELYEPDHFEKNCPDPWSAYQTATITGMPSTPKIKLAVAHLKGFYESKAGAVDYEEILHGGKVERVGNNSAQNFKKEGYKAFHEWITLVALSSKKTPSMTALAERFIEITPGLGEVDSFLRGYRRWKKTNI